MADVNEEARLREELDRREAVWLGRLKEADARAEKAERDLNAVGRRWAEALATANAATARAAAAESEVASLKGSLASANDKALMRGRAAHEAQEKLRAAESALAELCCKTIRDDKPGSPVCGGKPIFGFCRECADEHDTVRAQNAAEVASLRSALAEAVAKAVELKRELDRYAAINDAAEVSRLNAALADSRAAAERYRKDLEASCAALAEARGALRELRKWTPDGSTFAVRIDAALARAGEAAEGDAPRTPTPEGTNG